LHPREEAFIDSDHLHILDRNDIRCPFMTPDEPHFPKNIASLQRSHPPRLPRRVDKDICHSIDEDEHLMTHFALPNNVLSTREGSELTHQGNNLGLQGSESGK
jgi:hypothetical protein